MASAGAGGTMPPNFLLTPQQQNLLFAALNSNTQPLSGSPAQNALSISPTSFQSAAAQQANTMNGIQESPFLDNYDYDFGDSSFDFSFAADEQAKMIGDLPNAPRSDTKSDSADNENPEKRNHPDDEGEDDSPGNDPKRRESTDKVPKKPGRKPLTSEPSSVCFVLDASLNHSH